MRLVALVLRRAATAVAVLILTCLLDSGASLRIPPDRFPETHIPVVNVAWTYEDMSAPDIRNLIFIFFLHERRLESPVDAIARIVSRPSNTLPDSEPKDLRQRVTRADLAVVGGARVRIKQVLPSSISEQEHS